MTGCDYLFKYIIVGDAAVGKSALVTQFADKRFLPVHRVTLGADIVTRPMTIDGQTIKLQMWDTGGQDKYLSITRSYFRGAAGILIVYDITQRKSFENLSHWLTSVRTYTNSPNSVIYLIGNKSDLTYERKIGTEEGERFAKANGLTGYFETSAKTASNVEVVFTNMAIEIYDRIEAGTIDSKKQVNGIKLEATSPSEWAEPNKKKKRRCCN